MQWADDSGGRSAAAKQGVRAELTVERRGEERRGEERRGEERGGERRGETTNLEEVPRCNPPPPSAVVAYMLKCQ